MCVCVYIYTHMYICIYVYIRICIRMCIYIYILDAQVGAKAPTWLYSQASNSELHSTDSELET